MKRFFLNGAIWPVACLAALICLAVFAPAWHGDFINWDDQNYVTNNTAIRALDGNFLRWAFTEMYLGWWMPLTWISFALDYAVWGLQPAGYHLTNILFHGANAGLVVLIADALFRQSGDHDPGDSLLYPAILLVTALVWGVHPMRVESVAWVTERKDVLNGFFFLLTLFHYLQFTRSRRTATEGSRRAYCLALLCFALSLMAKSVSVVLPAMLLILDCYPLQRLQREGWRQLLLEKVPFAMLSLGMAAVTLALALEHRIIVTGLTLAQRAQISGNAVFEYLRLLLFPVDIIPLYIIPAPLPASYLLKSVVVLVAMLLGLAVWKRFPAVPALLLLFLLPLLPTLAFTQNGIQSLAMRFTYLPSLALALALPFVLYRFAAERDRSRLVGGVLGCLVLAGIYGAVTLRQIGFWRDSAAMWSRVIVYQPFDRAYFYRGLHYADKGNFAAAIADYSTTLTIAHQEGMPDLYNILAFRGEALIGAERYQEAVADLTAAIAAAPRPLYFYHRAIALEKLGMTMAAAADRAKAGDASGKMQWY